jgi:hypothetical protein
MLPFIDRYIIRQVDMKKIIGFSVNSRGLHILGQKTQILAISSQIWGVPWYISNSH